MIYKYHYSGFSLDNESLSCKCEFSIVTKDGEPTSNMSHVDVDRDMIAMNVMKSNVLRRSNTDGEPVGIQVLTLMDSLSILKQMKDEYSEEEYDAIYDFIRETFTQFERYTGKILEARSHKHLIYEYSLRSFEYDIETDCPIAIFGVNFYNGSTKKVKIDDVYRDLNSIDINNNRIRPVPSSTLMLTVLLYTYEDTVALMKRAGYDPNDDPIGLFPKVKEFFDKYTSPARQLVNESKTQLKYRMTGLFAETRDVPKSVQFKPVGAESISSFDHLVKVVYKDMENLGLDGDDMLGDYMAFYSEGKDKIATYHVYAVNEDAALKIIEGANWNPGKIEDDKNSVKQFFTSNDKLAEEPARYHPKETTPEEPKKDKEKKSVKLFYNYSLKGFSTDKDIVGTPIKAAIFNIADDLIDKRYSEVDMDIDHDINALGIKYGQDCRTVYDIPNERLICELYILNAEKAVSLIEASYGGSPQAKEDIKRVLDYFGVNDASTVEG